MRNYYEILGIENTADIKEIKRAYARLLRQFPPETCPDEFKEIRKAYEVLSKEQSRLQYDKSFAPVPFHWEKPVVEQVQTEPILLDPTHEEVDEEKVTPETDFEKVKRLLDIHCTNKEYQKAVDILNAVIDETNPRSSKSILYYIERLRVLSAAGRFADFTYAVDRMFDSLELKKDDEVTKYIFKLLKGIVKDFYREKKYSYWKKLIISMHKVDPYNTDVQEFEKAVYELEECRTKLKVLKEDGSVESCVKELITLWLNESMDENEREKALADIEDQLLSMKKSSLLRSLNRLKRKYFMFYCLDTQYFNNLYIYLGKGFDPSTGGVSPRAKQIALILIIISFLLAMRFITYLASQNRSAYAHNGNISGIPRVYNSGELNVELPSMLPEGYVLQEVLIQYDKSGAVEKLPKESFGYTMDSLKIKRNVQYVKLTFDKGKTTISFEAKAEGEGFKTNPSESIGLTADPDIGISKLKDDGGQLQLIIYRASLQGFDPNNPDSMILNKWINYTISTSDGADGASKEDLLLIARGLKWIKIQ